LSPTNGFALTEIFYLLLTQLPFPLTPRACLSHLYYARSLDLLFCLVAWRRMPYITFRPFVRRVLALAFYTPRYAFCHAPSAVYPVAFLPRTRTLRNRVVLHSCSLHYLFLLPFYLYVPWHYLYTFLWVRSSFVPCSLFALCVSRFYVWLGVDYIPICRHGSISTSTSLRCCLPTFTALPIYSAWQACYYLACLPRHAVLPVHSLPLLPCLSDATLPSHAYPSLPFHALFLFFFFFFFFFFF